MKLADGCVPEEVNKSIEILWGYSNDAYHTMVSKEEALEDGFEVETEHCIKLMFFLPSKD